MNKEFVTTDGRKVVRIENPSGTCTIGVDKCVFFHGPDCEEGTAYGVPSCCTNVDGVTADFCYMLVVPDTTKTLDYGVFNDDGSAHIYQQRDTAEAFGSPIPLCSKAEADAIMEKVHGLILSVCCDHDGNICLPIPQSDEAILAEAIELLVRGRDG